MQQWRATTQLDEVIEPGTEVRVVDVTGARLVVEPME
jgi:membrane protein implicated in regulation of membrane protease activity